MKNELIQCEIKCCVCKKRSIHSGRYSTLTIAALQKEVKDGLWVDDGAGNTMCKDCSQKQIKPSAFDVLNTRMSSANENALIYAYFKKICKKTADPGDERVEKYLLGSKNDEEFDYILK